MRYQIDVLSLDGKYQGSFIKENLLFERHSPVGKVSPNGLFLAFIKGKPQREKGTELVLFDIKNNHNIDIPDLKGYQNCQSVNWSPDGKELILSCEVDLVANLYNISLDDGTLHRITNCLPIEAYCYHPAWSPNGKWIIYTRNGTCPTPSEYWDPYVINASCLEDTLTCMDLDIGPFTGWHPYTWAPDSCFLHLISLMKL